MERVVAPIATLLGGLVGTGAGFVAVTTASEVVTRAGDISTINLTSAGIAGVEAAFAAAFIAGAIQAGRVAVGAYRR